MVSRMINTLKSNVSPRLAALFFAALLLAALVPAPGGVSLLGGTAAAQGTQEDETPGNLTGCTEPGAIYSFATGECVIPTDNTQNPASHSSLQHGFGRGILSLLWLASMASMLLGVGLFIKEMRKSGGGINAGVKAMFFPMIGGFMFYDLAFTVRLMTGLGRLAGSFLSWLFGFFF